MIQRVSVLSLQMKVVKTFLFIAQVLRAELSMRMTKLNMKWAKARKVLAQFM